jgi:phospholipid/cholesterol/gamma-HCH transport system substrate-binding protein
VQKQAPTLGRLLVMVGFALSCFGLLLFLWLAFGGPIPLKPKGYRFHASFGEATQLAKEADVRISGVSVGKVKDIQTDKQTGRSDATIELKEGYAPIPIDTRATLRQKTLLGETYVELSPGDKAKGTIQEDGTLSAARVSPTVELDEIFRAFDAKTREAFRVWMQQQALGIKGRGRDINEALGNLAPFAQDTTRLLVVLNSQEGAVQRLVRNTGEVFNALSERRGQLAGLITNSNKVFEATASRNQQLEATFRALPTFEKESEVTLRRLTAFSKNTNPLVTQLRPAAVQLSPTLQSLDALAPDLKQLFKDINPLVDASKAGLPATQKFLDQLHPLLADFDPVLRQINPILLGLGSYKSELTAFFANTVGATQAYTIPKPGVQLHYLRTMNPVNPENFAVYPRRIGSNRPNPYAYPRNFDNLPQGMPAYETRQCGRGDPTIVNPLTGILPQELQDNIQKYAFGAQSGTVPAPPCKQQGPFPFQGETSQFPHVKPSTGATARQRGHKAR